ncbi:MAG: hypothetical protein HPPSJP_2110 [Candidatus Hepatoplasma scabrum]|nr:MAG: hypothetical protein HPPSJP_2110 [Candidatus Hepatoplasma sp.]
MKIINFIKKWKWIVIIFLILVFLLILLTIYIDQKWVQLISSIISLIIASVSLGLGIKANKLGKEANELGEKANELSEDRRKILKQIKENVNEEIYNNIEKLQNRSPQEEIIKKEIIKDKLEIIRILNQIKDINEEKNNTKNNPTNC